MSEATPFRRIVTGLDNDGESCVILDGPTPHSEIGVSYVWRSAVPADNSGTEDVTVPFTVEMAHYDGSNFLLIEIPPGRPPFMHATDTIDYVVVLSGHATLMLEKDEVKLGPGDFLVDRGVQHAWRNDGPETTVLASMSVPSKPVGKGRTV